MSKLGISIMLTTILSFTIPEMFNNQNIGFFVVFAIGLAIYNLGD